MELANGLINVGKPATTPKRKKGRPCTKDDYEPPNKASPTSSNRKVDGIYHQINFVLIWWIIYQILMS